ncbi:MAG TPA: NAD(P)/FAD-dependent oxidoreductase [Gemmatimonadaceae bacterium]|nr:NAD(P)/FAD-dependent oxidoreductase [Gemmatimonadaceae bacterium]
MSRDSRDVIVIGAGANGLAAAAWLARRGRRVVVLERREAIGGMLATEEFHPGFRANACRDDVGWISPDVLQLLQGTGPPPAPAPGGLLVAGADGAAFPLPGNPAEATRALREVSAVDAARWEGFCGHVARVAGFLEAAYALRAPRVQSRAPADLFALVSLGRRLRGLGRREMMEVLRAVPMPVADLLDEWFESSTLRGALATIGVRDVLHGPLSGGTALVFYHHHVGLPLGQVGGRRTVPGGNGALPEALAAAARRAGAEIRLGQAVGELLISEGRIAGARLDSGDELWARTVISSADPRRTFALVDPSWFDPALLDAVDHVRMRGATARVHFALDGLPRFGSGQREWPAEWLRGAILLAPDLPGVERAYDAAKYGQVPEHPALTAVLPTLLDPSLAPAGCHVLSVSVHHVPYARRDGWTDGARDALGSLVQQRLEAIAPDLAARIAARRVLTPADLETRFGVTEGSLTHGELALDQILFMRPVPACARYETPLPGLWLCGAGTHPANGAGASGALAARELLGRR